ncbi:MAG: CAP domain-containing protein [Actinobacteria bacterium]|nr:CAP domain-containing protein [Actinomycetota bacterium]
MSIMRHIAFWAFQVSVVAGVIFMSLAIFEQLQSTTKAQDKASQAVLAETTHTFQSADDRLDTNDVLARVNNQRIQTGLSPLLANAELEQVAQERADDMQREDYYAHQNPNSDEQFSDLLRKQQIAYTSACENLNMTFHTQVDAIVVDWLQSNAGHRECMLAADISQAGYAVARIRLDGNQTAYIVVGIHLAE